MSKREWLPGEVGTFGGAPALRTTQGWTHCDGSVGGAHQDDFRALRPLVVIDPEDTDEFADLLTQILTEHDTYEPFRSAVRQVFREFANPKPPRPEEPTGHLAVVEDIRGVRWVNWRDPRDGLTTHERAWQSAEMDTEEWRDYRDIDAVRVLSEGVTA